VYLCHDCINEWLDDAPGRPPIDAPHHRRTIVHHLAPSHRTERQGRQGGAGAVRVSEG
jgi:hypothetical protein